MHLPGKKDTKPDISGPMDGRVMENEPHPQMLYNAAQAHPGLADDMGGVSNPQAQPTTHGLVHPHPDPAHVYREGANQPAGAMDAHDPTRGAEAGQAYQPAAGGMTDPSADPNVKVAEEKLGFKDQVRAYHKIHRGTLLGDQEQKETGKKILAGEVPPQGPSHV